MRSSSLTTGLLGILLFGCAEEAPPPARVRAIVGDGCEVSSECVEGLVCIFQRCHAECAQSRDCATGASCRLAEDGSGACNLPDERGCARSSDCPGEQLCGNDQKCRDACVQDRDCLGEQVCAGGACAEPGELSTAGKLPVLSPSLTGLVCGRTADCAPPLVCRDQVCREECLADRDCEEGSSCVGSRCVRPAAVPPFCIPGHQIVCACAVGVGQQMCREDGSGFGECAGCPAVAGAGGAGGGTAGAAGESGAAGAFAGGSPSGGAGGAGVGGDGGQAGGGVGGGGGAGAGGQGGGSAGGQAGAPTTCGNGTRDGDEACDGAPPPFASCASVSPYAEGSVACGSTCALDTSGCRVALAIEKPLASPVKGEVTPTDPDDPRPPPLSLSATGRYLAFSSRNQALSPLPPGAEAVENVFVADLLGAGFDPGVSGKPASLRQITRGAGGTQPDGDSSAPVLSADGRRVLFVSLATNLGADVPGDGEPHFYLSDLDTGKTARVDIFGTVPSGRLDVDSFSLSEDGTRVVFTRSEGSAPEVRRPYLRDLTKPAATRIKGPGGAELGLPVEDARFCGSGAVALQLLQQGNASTRKHALRRVDLDTGAEEELAAPLDRDASTFIDLKSAGCSADGSVFAYLTNRDPTFQPNPEDPSALPSWVTSYGVVVSRGTPASFELLPLRSFTADGDAFEQEWHTSPQRSVVLGRDGGHLVYTSNALPTNVRTDNVYLFDLTTNTSRRVSTLPGFGYPFGDSGRPALAIGPPPGRHPIVVFLTTAPQVLPGDVDAEADLVRVEIFP